MATLTTILLLLILAFLLFLLKKCSDLAAKIEKISQTLTSLKSTTLRAQADEGAPPPIDPEKPKNT
jgi:hypothetical protein